MVRISKQSERRQTSPRKHQKPSIKTGPKEDVIKGGFKPQVNGIKGAMAEKVFIPKIK